MASRKRRRVRASEMVRQRRPWRGMASLFFVAITLSVIVAYKAGVGDSTLELLDALGLDPHTQLPESVLDRSPEGAVDTGLVVRFRDSRVADVLACATDGQVGQYVVQITVDPRGTQLGVEVVYDDLSDPKVGACVLQRARGWRVPPVGGRGGRMRLPFNFVPRRS